MESPTIGALRRKATLPGNPSRRSVVSNYLKDKAARLFNSCVAALFLIMAQSGMAAPSDTNDFCLAVLAKQSITLNGNMLVDSFNSMDPSQSTNGRYDSSKRGDAGDMASVASGVNVISDSGNTSVYGHFYTGPSGTVTISGNASVGSTAWVNGNNRGIQPGWYSNDFQAPTIPDAVLPAVTFTTLKKTSGIVNGTNYTYVVTNGYYQASSFSLNGNSSVCVNGNAVLYFPTGLQISSQAFIYIAPGSKLIIYSGGNPSMAGGGIINGAGLAADCSFLGLASCTSIQYSGSSDFIGTIYAPEAALSMSGGGSAPMNFDGAVVVNSISISGHYQFHYDQSLCITCDSPVVTTSLANQSVCPGQTAVFSVDAAGTSLAFQWLFNGSIVGSASTLTLTNVGPGSAGTYSVIVSGACGSVTNSATLSVSTNVTAAALTSQTICPGSPVTFGTTASGTGPFTYVWRLNGAQLPTQTSATLTISSASATDAGLYAVEVYGSCNSVTNAATLTVSANVTANPLISQTVCPGNQAAFSTIASGSGPFSYIWRVNGAQLLGQTSNNLAIPSVIPSNAGTYSVEVYGGCDSVTNIATLTVSANVTATTLTSQAVCPGSPVTFMTTASGSGPLGYVWRFNRVQLIGQTADNLTIPSVTSSNSGTYAVEVYGGCNSITNFATLTVSTNVTATALTSQAVCPGSPATFSTTASGTGPFAYVWRFNGAQLVGQTDSSLSITSCTSKNAGTYAVEVYGSCNSVTNLATLTVSTNVAATALTSQMVCPGSPVTFVTTASGSGSFTYVWRFNGEQLVAQTESSLNIPSATNAGTYAVEVYGSCNSVTNTATLTVSSNVTATALASQTVCLGSLATFTTSASGTGPYSYIWRFGGVQLTNQTANSLTIASVSFTDAGTYAVEVYGSCNSVTNFATLTVSTNLTATTLSSQTVCPGSPVTFMTTASGSGPFTYVWRFNGGQLLGQTANSLTIASAASTNAGTYAVEIYGSCKSVTNTATITVSTNVSANTLTSQIVCPGSPAAFSTIASGTGPFTYVWRFNGAQLVGESTNALTIASTGSTNAGVYSVEVYGSCDSVTNFATLTVSTNITATALTSQTVCPGSPVTFMTTASSSGPFTYVWRFNGSQLAGQTADSLTIPSVTSTNAGTYAVEVYGNCSSVTNTATLTVNTNATATALSSQTVCAGDTAMFSTIASGSGPFTYVWRLNSSQLPGQTGSSLSIVSVTSSNAGIYSVEVYGSCDSVTNAATLTVNSSTTATPLTSLVKITGTSATFSTAAGGTGPFTFVWRLNGTLLSGQTTNSLTIASVASTNIGTYTVEVHGDCNSVTNSATLTLATPPTVTILNPTNGSTFIALANMTVLAQVIDLDSTVTNVEFFAVTNAPGVTNVPGVATLFSPTNKIGQNSSGPPYFILWTNVTPGVYYLGARGTDQLGAVGLSQIVMVNVLDQPPVVQNGPMQFNPQTDVFEQPVRVTNPTYYTYDGVRLLISNLAPGVLVYNSTGTTNGLPFVQSILPIPPGGSVDFVIEYYVLSRVAPKPVFTVQLISPSNAVNQIGPTQHVDRGRMMPNKSFLLEFNTLSNRVYYLQYSTDLVHWSTAVPAITGTGNVIDWIDNGPPVTASPVSTQPKRFYRLILLP